MSERERRNYQILNTIATGGTAVLYKAIQTSLDRPVVIKRLHAHLISDPNFTRRFQLEAKAAASLDHENIVRIIDFGAANDNYYIVMEYIDGPSLKDVLAARPVLGEELALLVAHEICMGLDHAHQHGIIHRDIKPANIMITNEGQVKITDFGLAKLHQSQTQQTVSATLLGTPLYMSPEQAIGESIDGRSDLFSLGTICYEAITGTQPFRGDNYVAVIQSITRGAVPPLSRVRSDVGQEAEAIVMKALEREPGKRFRTALEMARSIELFLGQEKIISVRERLKRLASGAEAAVPPSVSTEKKRPSRRTGLRAALALAATGVAVLAFIAVSERSPRLRSWIETFRGAHPDAPASGTLMGGQGEPAPGISMTPIEESAPAAEATPDTMAPETTAASARDTIRLYVEEMAAPPKETPAAPEKLTAPVVWPAAPAAPERAKSAPAKTAAEEPETEGFLRIAVDPPAEVLIDGHTRVVGDQLPTLTLSAGSHEIHCRREGYRDYVETVTIKRGELSQRSVILQAITGGIAIETSPGAQIVIDGNVRGITPLSAPLEIPSGTHEVELRKVGFRTWKSAVYVPPNETLHLNIGLVSL